MAIRVNMLRWRVFSEAQPRSKNGAPAHSATGVASANCTQPDALGEIRPLRSTRWPPISSTNTGTVRAAAIQNRRVMSASSGLGPSSALSVRSEEHTSELQSLMRISYAVFCLKKKTNDTQPLLPQYSHTQYTTI